MKKLFFYFIIFSFLIIASISKIFPEDPFWVDCSDEKDLYKYVAKGWKVERVHRKGDIIRIIGDTKYHYIGEEPQIILFKDKKIKGLNFGWRCSHLEGPEFNISRERFEKLFSSL